MIRLAFVFLVCASMATAQSAGDAAVAAADRLAKAAESLNAATSASDRVSALTETVRAYEDGLVAMREGLRRAAIRETVVSAELAAKSDEVGRLLGVLQTMGRAPTPLLMLHPSGPVGTARSGMLIADVTPAIQEEVADLRLQLEEVATLRALQQNAAATLQQGLDGAQAARTALSQAVSERTDLPLRFTEDPIQTALLLASTETLEAFSTGLIDAFITNDSPVDAATQKGGLSLPVQGQILRRFDAADAAGIRRPGIIIAARPRALVTAPVAATVLFRGPLLDYGNVIILEPAADVLFVIAGLEEVYGEAGQVIPQGSPIGLLGGDVPNANGKLSQSGSNTGGTATQTLYLEVREGQSPVDPADWFVLDAR